MASQELESDTYDVVVLGTGLAQSIAAAALAKAGKTVLHLDPNEYYGGPQASLTLDELVSWAEQHAGPSSASEAAKPTAGSSTLATASTPVYSSATTSTPSEALQSNCRRYALSLYPAVLPSRGELIDTLIKSDVSKYVSFRLLDSVSIWADADSDGEGGLKRVPGSKEDVFKDKTASLIDKRRLMKFLLFAAGDFDEDKVLEGKSDQPLSQFLKESFSLPEHLSTAITYGLAHCTSPLDPTLPALNRARRYLRSIGRYGAGAFLIGQYGGAGEVAQGFCRACAVFGGTYVLGPSALISSVQVKNDTVELNVACHPKPVIAKHLVASADLLPNSTPSGASKTVAKAIALVDSLPPALKRPEIESAEGEGTKEEDDTAVVIFPRTTEEGSAVRVLMMGEGTGSCPSGQFVLYLSTEATPTSDPKEILQPFLHKLAPGPIFESYHLSQLPSPTPSTSPIVLVNPYQGFDSLTEGLDWEAGQGRKAYESIIGSGDGAKEFFERDEGEGEDEDDVL